MDKQQNRSFKIKLHPFMDEKTLNAISDATLEVIGDQLYKPPVLTPALTPDDIGKDIKGEGIYLGTYAPVDRDGVSLKKVFNVFAAPEDLFIKETRQVHKKAKGLRGLFGATVVENETKYIEIFTYEDAVKYVAGLKSWHGHDGANHATDKELYTAIKDSTYNGGWIIPTRDILLGKDLNDNKTTPDNILAHKDKGSLKGTFKMAASGGSDCPDWYWSSTENRVNPSLVWDVRLPDGGGDWNHKDYFRLSCRPVRLVPIK